jgi:3-hydroxyisobutyrate dehydrogenase-like beta-hydroxyacid dehydrogenase
MGNPRMEFVGVGLMGRCMAKHLPEAGFSLPTADIVKDVVHNALIVVTLVRAHEPHR